ncbi:glycosyltransferase [Bacillus salacetis]|uniref:glycosyltransferase n=1 Tax=Bacillus salacetis TaxID=2315464 RepID=UPI003B9F3F1F
MFRKKWRNQEKKFIFQDGSGKRWKRIWIITISLFVLLSIVLSAAGHGLFHNPVLPQTDFKESPVIKPISEPIKTVQTNQIQFGPSDLKSPVKIPREEIYGFYLSGSPISRQSLDLNIDSIGVLIPDWYWLDSELNLQTNKETEVINLAKENGVAIMPRLSLSENAGETGLPRLLGSADSRSALIETLYHKVKAGNYSGINIDFKDLRVNDKESFTALISELYELFHANGLEVTVTVPPENEAYDYRNLTNSSDRIIVKLFKELAVMEEPEPVAPLGWVQQIVEQIPVPPEKMVVSLNNESYEWDSSSQEMVNCLMFHEVMKTAASSGLKSQWDPVSMNPYLRYTKDNVPHIIWFLDAATSYNIIKLALSQGVKGIAVDQLGHEDSGLWKYIPDTSAMEEGTHKLHSMENPIPVIEMGSGEVIRLSNRSQQGKRTVHLNTDGYINNETYEKYPLPYYIEKSGGNQNKKIVLSFDDGPDPAYTPKILDILSKEQVRASFFVVGRQAALHPEILQRIHREGHEIGNHTFSHSNITEDSPATLQAELNSTQRLIQQVTGHSSILYRPPYTTDLDEDSPEDLLPYLQAQEMGYTMVGSYIDPKDWYADSTKNIVNRLLNNLSDGNIVLLHDSGGDRSATVEALPKIIKVLKDEGYTFVTTADLINKEQTSLMPPVEDEIFPYMFFYKIANTLFIWLINFCIFFFSLGIILGILRLILLFTFSYKHSRQKSNHKPSPYPPFVSVIIPAYNEEAVIEKTLQSILRSHYRNFEVIVINDGSTDHTAEVVKKISKNNIRVRQTVKVNEGKTAAINYGFLKARGEIIVTLDADTSIVPDTISLLVNHFKDEKVAGVSGNVRIGNIRNVITLWQHIEYVTGFNLEKRAFQELNSITVVPGAVGAWRKSAIAEADFFEEDTLAEDTDITLKLLRMGYQINYEPSAKAYTEAPETVRSFVKQRFRWSYGILQCLWKHSSAFFNPKQKGLGFVGLPYMWSQYIFSAFAPLIDIVFLIGLFGDTPKIITYYILFFLIDLFVAVYAFHLEGISKRPLILLIVQRIVYRQLLTFTVWKAFAYAAKGVLIGWNKLTRSGNVKLPD